MSSPNSGLQSRGFQAVIEIAGDLGLSCSRPILVRDSSNLLVYLAPDPVIAKIPTGTLTIRPGDAWQQRDVDIASYLASVGAPVVPPSTLVPPGPHHRDGITVTFWEHVQEVEKPLDAFEAGRGLRVCHEALREFKGELPSMAAVVEIKTIIDRLAQIGALDEDGADSLWQIGSRMQDQLSSYSLPSQPIHGDAHLDNAMMSARGPLWHDWEDAFSGPLEWDRGCLQDSRYFEQPSVDDAQRGYGAEIETPILETFTQARHFQMALWDLVFIADRGVEFEVSTFDKRLREIVDLYTR